VSTRAWALAAVLATALVVDLSRAPDRQLAARAAVAAIHVYQATLSRAFAATGLACRFDPTCSHYGEAVIRRFGVVRGGWMAAKRVIRCGPWTPAGTVDPPPMASGG
jgi:putative membrane protein insertion efficiency factor